MARLPAASENAAVNAIVVAGTTYYLSIHSADPGTTGANEITGYTGNRPSIVFGSGASGVASSTSAQTFANMPAEAGGVPYIGLWTAASGGTYIGGGTTTGLSGAIAAGANVAFAIAAIQAQIS